MAEGLRDAFIENDVIGNYNLDTDFLGNIPTRNRRKKVKRRRRKVKHHKRRHRVRRVKKSRRSFKKRSSGRIKYTKRGQPYKIMPNGRARFLKKR